MSVSSVNSLKGGIVKPVLKGAGLFEKSTASDFFSLVLKPGLKISDKVKLAAVSQGFVLPAFTPKGRKKQLEKRGAPTGRFVENRFGVVPTSKGNVRVLRDAALQIKEEKRKEKKAEKQAEAKAASDPSRLRILKSSKKSIPKLGKNRKRK